MLENILQGDESVIIHEDGLYCGAEDDVFTFGYFALTNKRLLIFDNPSGGSFSDSIPGLIIGLIIWVGLHRLTGLGILWAILISMMFTALLGYVSKTVAAKLRKGKPPKNITKEMLVHSFPLERIEGVEPGTHEKVEVLVLKFIGGQPGKINLSVTNDRWLARLSSAIPQRYDYMM